MNIISKIKTASIIVSALLITSCSDDDSDIANTTGTSELTDSQSDLEITLSNYENNQVFETGFVEFEFVITNVGETTLEAGSNVYVSLKFDNIQTNLDLTNLSDDAATTLTLSEDLAPGEFFTYITSPVTGLDVEATLNILPSVFESEEAITYVDVCSIVWGTTEASIGTFESDLNSEDNTFCIGFGNDEVTDVVTTDIKSTDSEPDLALTLSNYENNQVFETGDVDFEFVITNVGESILEAGASIYMTLKFDDVESDLDLVQLGQEGAFTALLLDEDLAPGESFIYRTSPVDFLNVEATINVLPFIGLEGTYVDICSILWGTTEASVGTFESDSNSEDNTFCIGFGTN